MKALPRSLALLAAVFTVVVAGVLWWQSLRSQSQLRDQVLLQAEQRSLHVADAMAGQVQAQLNTMDVTLRTLRDHWVREPRERFDVLAKDALASLPPGLVSHVSVADASGHLAYNSLGLETGRYVGDRDSFQVARLGPDAMRVSATVRSRLTGRWVFAVDRPVLRQGRFDGVVYLVVESAYIARELGELELSDQDVVSLVHPDGHYLARSQGNEGSMGKQVPADRPYRAQPTLSNGTYRVDDVVDHSPRTYGWHRLAGSGLVVSVGLADSSVLAPLAPALRRNLLVTGVLSLLLLGFGGVIVRDQLRMARNQRALARSEAGLKEAQQLAGLGSWEYDLGSGRLWWSDEVYRIFEADPALVQPSFDRFLELVHPDDQAMVRQAFHISVRDRQTYNVVHRVLLPGGRLKYVRERGVTEYDGDRPVRSMGTVLDITEVRTAQLALQQLNEELESRVTERTHELAQANRELEAFAYSVSHDLRTPLRSIHGFACVLEEEEAGKFSDAGRKHLQRIQDGSRRMGKLITDLLSLTHLNRARMHQEPVNLSELALEVAGELQNAEPERKVDWHIEEGMTAMADPGLMRAMLQNLLGNAWKYTSQTPEAKVQFTCTGETGGLTVFCVSDNGAGFDMAYSEQLFMPFKRLHAHHEFEGSGVGLATVQRIVQRHGGTVRGEGAVGEGAKFYFSLPAAPVVTDLGTW